MKSYIKGFRKIEEAFRTKTFQNKKFDTIDKLYRCIAYYLYNTEERRIFLETYTYLPSINFKLEFMKKLILRVQSESSIEIRVDEIKIFKEILLKLKNDLNEFIFRGRQEEVDLKDYILNEYNEFLSNADELLEILDT